MDWKTIFFFFGAQRYRILWEETIGKTLENRSERHFCWRVLPPRARARSYRVGDIVFVVAAVAPFQRQVAGEPQLVALHGIADVLEEFGLDARPTGAAVVQEVAAELE